MFRALRPFVERDPDTVLICDGGEFAQWGQSMLPVRRRLINGVTGSIGSALSFALAARMVEPKAPVFAVLGDGTIGFHIAEFETAVRRGLPFVAVLGNDARWNAESEIQRRDYGANRMHGCELLPARYDQVVAALGGHGEHVERAADLPARNRTRARERQAILHQRDDRERRRAGDPAPAHKRFGRPDRADRDPVPVAQRNSGERFQPIKVGDRTGHPQQRRRHHHFGGTAGAVVAFHRDAEPLLRQRPAIDALCAGLDEERVPNRSMICVQNRPVPPTCQGCAAQASRNRAAALARFGVSPTPVPKRAKPRARLTRGSAQVGAEQPSMAQSSCANGTPVRLSSAPNQALHRMDGRVVRAVVPMAQATQRKPACLPEQLLCTAPAVPPPRVSACADGW